MHPKKLIVIIFAIVIILVIGVTYIKPNFWYVENVLHPINYFFYDIDYKKLAAMKSIELGMSEEEVIAILGKPEEISYKKYITQTHGNRSDYNKDIFNPNKCYWYSTGIDLLACIIFDSNNKVIYVNVGGT